MARKLGGSRPPSSSAPGRRASSSSPAEGAASDRGAAGVAFFDLDYTLVNDILPYLRLGLFR